MQAVFETIATSGPAVIVLATLVGLAILIWVIGTQTGWKQTKRVEGDSAPATIKAAIDRQTEATQRHTDAVLENTQVKRDEKAAIDRMHASNEKVAEHIGVLVSTMSANNRLMTEAGHDSAETVNILRAIEKSCIANGEGIRTVERTVSTLNQNIVNMMLGMNRK